MKKEIEEIRKLMTEVENRLQTLESESEPERRLWNVDAICGKMECLTQNPYSKLKVVADYCNEMDEFKYSNGKPVFIYPYYFNETIEIRSTCVTYATPHFNSSETLKRLISENEEFFNNLLRPKE